MIKTNQDEAYEDYNTLIRMGGRPRHPIRPEPTCSTFTLWNGIVRFRDEEGYNRSMPMYTYRMQHWGGEAGRIHEELLMWKRFREYQELARQDPEKFFSYQERVKAYRKSKGIEGNVCLQLQLQQQTQLDDWKEYHTYQHKKLRYIEWDLKRAQTRMAASKQMLEEAASDGAGQLAEENLSISQAQLSSANNKLEEWISLLKWIEEQLQIIASENALGSQSSNIHFAHGAEHEASVTRDMSNLTARDLNDLTRKDFMGQL